MNPYRFLLLLLSASLIACAQQPTHDGAAKGEKKETGTLPRVVAAHPDARKSALPANELSEDLLYKLMLAEIAVQRGQPHVAVPTYLELARETRDPRLAQRATEVAWNARFQSAALEAATLWLEYEPKSTQARQVIAALFARQADLSTAQPQLEKWLAADPKNVGQSFLQLSSLLGRHKDKAAVLKLMQGLAADYPDVPEARLAVAQAAWNAKDEQLSLTEARAALALRPDWDIAALFVAQVLQRRSQEEAIRYLGEYLENHPKARDVRLNFARVLVGQKRYPEAREQFEVLVREFPQNADVTMAVALLAFQTNDYETAEIQLKRVLELDYKDPDAVRLYLGQVNEERKQFDEALKWYSAVKPGAQYISAQARYAGVLAKQGKLSDARTHLQQVTARSSSERVQLTQAEAQLLREANAYQEAFDVLGLALKKMPDTPDLLYDYAMAAEKVDRIDVVEANLRKLIKIRPDHAHAYNALGYTLADRNERIEEAHGLIQTALKLSPDDPFILDSMGWVLYRMGRSQEGLEYLQRAYKVRPDAEIAAHLGEVLWAVGKRDEARNVWGGAMKEHPDNEALQKTVKRFMP